MVLSNYTTIATSSYLNGSKEIDAITASDDMIHTNDALPATRKRTSQQRSAGFIDVDDFVVTKKAKTKSTEKEEIEEEFATTWICVECKEAECMMEPDATELLICDGVCRRVFHYPCAGLSQLPPDDVPFICNDCANEKHICALCSNYGFDYEDVSKCSKSNCGLFYHESCLSMRNVEVTIISQSASTCEEMRDTIIEGIDTDDSGDENEDFDSRKKVSSTKIIRRFVCPAHSCWTCSQIDLKDEISQQNIVDDSALVKKTKKKKASGGSGAFEAKKDSFLTVRYR